MLVLLEPSFVFTDLKFLYEFYIDQFYLDRI